MTAREAFGPTLRHQRERRGVTLEAIADSTKVSRSLFAALERNDVSRWPGGIYRRCFFRDYAAAIGLPADATLHEFLRLFPEPGNPLEVPLDDEPRRMRLMLVAEAPWKAPARNALAAVIDGGAVLLIGYTASTLFALNPWMTTAVAGLTCHALSTATLGKTLGMRCVSSNLWRRTPRSSDAEAIADLRRDWLTGFLQPAKSSTEGQAVT